MDIAQEILNIYTDEKASNLIWKDFKSFYLLKPQTKQILSYFKVEPTLTSSDLQELFESYQVKTLLQRLVSSNYLEKLDKEGKNFIYTLTKKGDREVDDMIKKGFLNKQDKYNQYLAEKRKVKVEESSDEEFVKKILIGLLEAEVKINIEDNIIIDLKKLAEVDFEAVDYIYANFEGAIATIVAHFKADNEKISKHDIIFINAHESIYQETHDIDRNYEGLVYTKGIITSKNETIKLRVSKYEYLCKNDSCPHSKDSFLSNYTIKECPNCKDKIFVKDKIVTNHYESKITNIESGVSLPLFLSEEEAKKFAYIGLGDEIEVIGYLEEKIIDKKKGEKEHIEKALFVNSFKTTDFVKDLSEEELKIAERILKNYPHPRDYLMLAFEKYIEKDFVKELFLMQQLTRYYPEQQEAPIHIAMMGEPGVGKNELIKVAEKYFPVCDSIVGADITDAGFKGTVNRDTGIKEIGLAKKTQNGTLFFNEFDKFVKSNNNGKKAASQLLNASITEQEIRLNKAGIKIKMDNLDLRHNIIFNPIEESIVNSSKPAYDFMGQILDKSLLSRMIPLYIKRDNIRSKKVFKLMLGSNKKKEAIKTEEYQILIKYLRSKKIKFDSGAEESLNKVFESILDSDDNHTISAERIGQVIIQLSKAVAKFNNMDVCDKACVKKACDYYWDSLKSCGIDKNNLDLLFMDNSVVAIKTKIDLKNFILQEIATSGVFIISNFEDKFDKKLLDEVILEIKKKGECAEFKKGELREVKN